MSSTEETRKEVEESPKEEETPKQEETVKQQQEQSPQQEAGGEEAAEDKGEEPKTEAPEPEAAGQEAPPAEKQEEVKEEEEEEEDEEEPDDGVPRVLVTGASGYIAMHVTKQLLEDGRFRVRGSVRNKKKKEKIQPLLDLVPDSKYRLRLVQADLEKPESWKKAVRSCSYVFHLASPFPAPDKPQTDEVLTPQAVEGTLSVLRACVEAGTVKRVVLTSSIAAISTGNKGNPGVPPNHLYTEKDWSDEASCEPYERSKLRAERAAWDFMQKLDEDKKFELVVVNPGYVQGPLLSPVGGEGTKALAISLLLNKAPAIPDVNFPGVDVRDVASAQMAALEKPEAAGNRYALVSETIGFREAARIIAAEFRPQGYKVPTTPLPKPVMWLLKLFNDEVKSMYPYVGKVVRYNNEKMVGELGVTPAYTMKQTILDTCYSLIDLGVVHKTPGYLGHPSTRPEPPPPAKQEEEKPEEPAKERAESTPVDKEEAPAEKEPESTPVDKEEVKAEEPAASQDESATEKEPEAANKEESKEEEPAAEDSAEKEPEESSPAEEQSEKQEPTAEEQPAA